MSESTGNNPSNGYLNVASAVKSRIKCCITSTTTTNTTVIRSNCDNKITKSGSTDAIIEVEEEPKTEPTEGA